MMQPDHHGGPLGQGIRKRNVGAQQRQQQQQQQLDWPEPAEGDAEVIYGEEPRARGEVHRNHLSNYDANMFELLTRTLMLFYVVSWHANQFWGALLRTFLWVVSWMTAARFVPLVLLGVGVATLPLQANQDPILDFTETVADIVDSVWNDWVGRAVSDVWYCVADICDLYNFVFELVMLLLRILVNLLSDLISKRDVGFDPYNDANNGAGGFDPFYDEAAGGMTWSAAIEAAAADGTPVRVRCVLAGNDGERGMSTRANCGDMVHPEVCTVCGYIHDGIGWALDAIQYAIGFLIDFVEWIIDNYDDFGNFFLGIFWFVFNKALDIPCFNDPIDKSLAVCICGGDENLSLATIIFDGCLQMSCLFNGGDEFDPAELPMGILKCMHLPSSVLGCLRDIPKCVKDLVKDNVPIPTGGLLGRREHHMDARATPPAAASPSSTPAPIVVRLNDTMSNILVRVDDLETYINLLVNALAGTNASYFPIDHHSTGKRSFPWWWTEDGQEEEEEAARKRSHVAGELGCDGANATCPVDAVRLARSTSAGGMPRGLRAPPPHILEGLEQLFGKVPDRKRSAADSSSSSSSTSDGVDATTELSGLTMNGLRLVKDVIWAVRNASAASNRTSGIPKFADLRAAIEGSNTRESMRELVHGTSSFVARRRAEASRKRNGRPAGEGWIVMDSFKYMRARVVTLSTRLLTPHLLDLAEAKLRYAGVPDEYIDEAVSAIYSSEDAARYDRVAKAIQRSLRRTEQRGGGTMGGGGPAEELLVNGGIGKRGMGMGAVKLITSKPNYIIALAMPFIMSRWGQVVLGSYADRFLEAFGDIYTEPLDELFTADYLEQFGEDLLDITINNGWLSANYVARLIGCQMWQLVLKVLTFIPGIGMIFRAPPVGMLAQLGPCPPLPLLDANNQVVHNIGQYLNSWVQCDSDQPCSTSLDCAGAPCHCDRKFQWTSIGFSLNEDHECPGYTGTCQCWPLMPCDAQAGKQNVSGLVRGIAGCSAEFGYEVRNVVWYNEPDTWRMIGNVMANARLGVTYAARFVLTYTGFSPMTVILPMILTVVSLKSGVTLFAFMMAVNHFMPRITLFVDGTLLAVAATLRDDAFWPLDAAGGAVLDLVRFPNYSEAEPLGHGRDYEGWCFGINLPSVFVGGVVYYMIGATVISVIASGLPMVVLGFAYQMVLYVAYSWLNLVNAFSAKAGQPDSYIGRRYGALRRRFPWYVEAGERVWSFVVGAAVRVCVLWYIVREEIRMLNSRAIILPHPVAGPQPPPPLPRPPPAQQQQHAPAPPPPPPQQQQQQYQQAQYKKQWP
jgi:hypothetical protein